MPLMQEAMTLEDFDRSKKGFPPVKKKVVARPEPKKPSIDNEIKFEDIPLDDFLDLEYGRIHTFKNEEGVRFVGYDVSILLSPNASIKRKPGRPKENEEKVSTEPKKLVGWMIEGDFLTLVRHCRDKINPNRIHW